MPGLMDAPVWIAQASTVLPPPVFGRGTVQIGGAGREMDS